MGIRSLSILVLCFAIAIPQEIAAEQTLFNCRDNDVRIEFVDDFSRSDPDISVDSTQSLPDRIETERHDFTQSTLTVGKGRFQIEAGYTLMARL